MEKKNKILPPLMPNFYKIEERYGTKQQGFTTSTGYDIKDFTEDEAKEYAQMMYNTFLKHWKTRKTN
jgi:hypothetical protein